MFMFMYAHTFIYIYNIVYVCIHKRMYVYIMLCHTYIAHSGPVHVALAPRDAHRRASLQSPGSIHCSYLLICV